MPETLTSPLSEQPKLFMPDGTLVDFSVAPTSPSIQSKGRLNLNIKTRNDPSILPVHDDRLLPKGTSLTMSDGMITAIPPDTEPKASAEQPAAIPLPVADLAPEFESPPIEVPIDESVPAFYGLLRIVHTARLAWARKTADRLASSQARRKEISRSSLAGQIVRSGFEAVTHAERRRAMRTARRANKIVSAVGRQQRLSAVFGRTDSQGRPLYVEDTEGLITNNSRPVYGRRRLPSGKMEVFVERAAYDDDYFHPEPFAVKDASGKLPFQEPSPRPHDLGTPAQLERLNSGRYPKKDRKADLKAGQRYIKTGRVIDRHRKQLQKTVEGENIRGRIARARIERSSKLVDRLPGRIQHLERLERTRDQIREQRQREDLFRHKTRRQESQQARAKRRADRDARRAQNASGVV